MNTIKNAVIKNVNLPPPRTRCKSASYGSLFRIGKKCTFLLFISAVLLLFAVSCRQPTVVQADNEYLTEMMRETVRPLRHNPDSAIAFLDSVWDSYGELMTYNEKVTFYNLRGVVHASKNEFETAETYYSKALQFAEKLNDGDFPRQAIIANNIALSRISLGNLPGALEAFRQTRALLGDNQNIERILPVYMDKGAIFAAMGNIDSALYYIRLAIDIAVAEGFRIGEATGLINLATAFVNLGNYRQAEENYREAALIFEEIGERRNLMITYNNLASVIAAQGRPEESLSYIRKSDEIAAEIGAPATAMHSYYARRGQMYLDEGNYSRSLEMFYRALALLTQWQDMRLMAHIKNGISKVYGHLGDFDRAIYYANEALRIAYENNISHLQLIVYRNLQFIHASRGDMDSFTAAAEAEQTLRDALFAEQSNRALHEMQVRYETERNQMQIAQQAEEIRHKRSTITLLIIIGITVFALSALIILFQRRKVQNITRIVQHYETTVKLRKEVGHIIEHKADDAEKDTKRSDISEKLFPEIERLFKEEKIYRQAKLTVDDVAKMLNTNRNYLSMAINECYGKRFSEFINTFRVDEAIEIFKELYKGDKYAHYTIQAIGEEVGFIGKNTFHTVFKQTTGITPSEYLKALNKRTVA